MAANPAGAGADPSMEDILASIRRILSEDEQAAQDAAPSQASPPQAAARAAVPAAASHPGDVFALDASMMVREPSPAAPPFAPPPPGPPPFPAPPPFAAPQRESPSMDPSRADPYARVEGLIAPEAAAAAASAVGSLRRSVEAGRSATLLRSGGPTLEDMVREELRPVLKSWLDSNLPPLVERLVRAEIERVVGRVDL